MKEERNMNLEQAKKLMELSDRELSRVANRYRYEPKIVVLENGSVRTESAPDWARPWLDGWSDIESTHKFLEEQLGVKFVKDTYSGHSDGGYNPHYTSKWGEFDFYGSYYDSECFIPILRWALTKFINKEIQK